MNPLSMNHGHHHHHHAPQGSSDRIAWAFFLNASFALIEFIGGWLTNSTAIMADAVHDLGDSLAIGSAWLLERLGQKSADSQFTYGYRRLSLLGALINSFVLITGSIWVLNAAIPRLLDPQMPMAEGMFFLALLGVAVNGYAAYRLSSGTTLNEKVLNWHLMEDVLGWAAVLIASIVLYFFPWPIIDPLLSIAFTLFILVNVVRNLWATGKVFFQASPDADLLANIESTLMEIPNIHSFHHLHLWSLDGEKHVLTAHLVMNSEFNLEDYNHTKSELHQKLSDYKLSHTTIEIEITEEECRDHPHH